VMAMLRPLLPPPHGHVHARDDKVCTRKTMRGLHELEFCLWDKALVKMKLI